MDQSTPAVAAPAEPPPLPATRHPVLYRDSFPTGSYQRLQYHQPERRALGVGWLGGRGHYWRDDGRDSQQGQRERDDVAATTTTTGGTTSPLHIHTASTGTGKCDELGSPPPLPPLGLHIHLENEIIFYVLLFIYISLVTYLFC